MGSSFLARRAENHAKLEKEILAKPKLTGLDYITVPLGILTKHKDFTQHAYRVMLAISDMPTAQIEQIDLNPRGRIK